MKRNSDLNSADNPDAASPSSDEDDFGLHELVPQYLMLCRRDLLAMQLALEELDFDRLRILSHNLKGSGGAYGFPRLTELGAHMENAAKAADDAIVRRGIAELKSFLDSKSR